MRAKKSYLVGASSLALATLIAKFIGAFYRIPLTNIIGAEGIGIYQLIFPVYSLLLTSSSGAMPIAISLIMSKHAANEDISLTQKRFTAIMSIILLIGLLSSLGLTLLARPLSIIQRNWFAGIGYVAIAPAVVLWPALRRSEGIFRGSRICGPLRFLMWWKRLPNLLSGWG